MDTIIATAFALLFGACWVMEMRTAAKARRQMRYNQHGQHSHNNKPGKF